MGVCGRNVSLIWNALLVFSYFGFYSFTVSGMVLNVLYALSFNHCNNSLS